MSTAIHHPVGRLLRIHGAGIGWTKARFDPITIDLWKPDADGRRVGVDTVLWAENGTCKSTLLALLFAVFRPNGNEFMLRKDRREFIDYLLEHRIGHLITEWSIDDGGVNYLFHAPRTRLIGVLMYQTTEAIPQRLFWTALTGDTLRWDDLPVQGITSTPATTAADFRSWLAQHKAQPQNEVMSTELQQVWLDHLEQEVGCDTELLRYQRDMNGLGEGGIASFFKEKVHDPRTFCQFLCGVIVPPEPDEATSTAIENLRIEHRNRPHLDLEVAFFERIEEQLQVVVGTWMAFDQATVAEADARIRLSRTLQRIVQYKMTHEQLVIELHNRANHLQQQAEKTEVDRQRENECALRWHQTELRLHFNATRRHAEQQRIAANDAAMLCNIHGAAAVRSKMLASETTLEQLKEQRRAADQDLEPFFQAHVAAAAALRQALQREINPLDDRFVDAIQRSDKAQKLLRDKQSHAEAIGKRRRELMHARSQAEAHINQRNDGINWLINNNILPREIEPLMHLAHLQQEVAVHSARERMLATGVEASKAKTTAAMHVAQTTLKQIEKSQGQESEATKRLSQHLQVKKSIQEHAGWIALNEGVDDPDIEGIGERVQSAISRCHDAMSVLERGRARDVEDAKAIDQTSLLPVSAGTEIALGFLSERAIRAMPASKSLADQVSDPTHLRALITADPARTHGVVVNSAMDLERVRNALRREPLNLREAVIISLPRHTPPETGEFTTTPDRIVVPPTDLAAWNYDAAQRYRQVIARREEQAGTEAIELQQRQLHLSGLVDAIGTYLKDHGPLVRDQVQVEIKAAQTEGERQTRLYSSQSETAKRFEQETKKLIDEWQISQQKCKEITVKEQSLRQHCDQHEVNAAKYREVIEQASKEDTRLEQEMQENRNEQEGLQADQKNADQDREIAKLLLAELKGDCNRIKDLPEDWATRIVPAYSLPEAKQTEDAAYEIMRSHDRTVAVQTQCQTIERRLREEKRELDKTIQPIPLERRPEVDEIATTPNRELLADEANRRHTELRERLGAAEQARKDAQARIDSWIHDHSRLEDMPAVADADTAAASAKLSEERACNLAKQHQQFLNQANGDKAKAKEIEDNLKELARDMKRLITLRKVPTEKFATSDETIFDLHTLREEIELVEEQDRIARDTVETARKNLNEGVAGLQDIIAAREFSVLEDTLKRPYVGDQVAIAREAEQRLVDIHQHLASARMQRDSFSNCVTIAAKRLQTLLEQVLAGLQTLNRVARISESKVPVLEGHPIIHLQNFPTHLTTADGIRVSERVLRSLLDEQGAIPSVALLACRLLEAAIHDGGGWDRIRINTVKIENDGKAVTVPLTEVVKESGGEAIVAGALIYMALYRMRQETKITGRSAGQQGGRLGALILDNPFGSCSRIDFIDVQKAIAEQMGLQLIYTCGTNDEQAVARLGHVVRLRARPEARGGSYVDAIHLGWHGRASPAIATAVGI
jgi:hypothetical protein